MVKKTDFNAKITEMKGRIPSITGLATSSALAVIKNKVTDVSSLVKETDYDTKILDIEKNMTTPGFNTMEANVFNARLAQANVKTKQTLMLSCQVLIKKLFQIFSIPELCRII